MAHAASARTSGRGLHRKPNTYARTLGLATAPLVAALPMIAAGAAPASAASTGTWDRLASCESGGNWSINTGNSYYGGLQFSDGTWDSNGGERFASRADLASKAEQIVIAERLLADRGWSPWPACSSRLGLSAADAKGDPDISPVDRASRSGAREAPAVAASKATNTTVADKAAAAKAAEKAADKAAASKAAEKAADKAAASKAAEKKSVGKHRKAAGTGDSYVVRRGDTLSAIARSTDLPGGWESLYRINRDTIGANPGLIFPGQRLSLG